MEELIYLTEEDIIEAHQIGFTEFGGSTFSCDKSCVEKRVVEPQTSYWGVEQHPGLFRKAAVYMYKICISHCFADGNKRAAFISTDLFLKYNGYTINVDQNELYEFVLSIANHEGRLTLDEIESWIKAKSVPY